jgi:hypothetical protein
MFFLQVRSFIWIYAYLITYSSRYENWIINRSHRRKAEADDMRFLKQDQAHSTEAAVKKYRPNLTGRRNSNSVGMKKDDE